MPEAIFDFAFIGAALKRASGLKQTPPQNDVHAIHKAPEPQEQWAGCYLGEVVTIDGSQIDWSKTTIATPAIFIGDPGASETHTLTEAQLPSHSHTVTPADLYWPGHGQRWVQDASGKWVTEAADEYVRDAQGNVVLDFRLSADILDYRNHKKPKEAWSRKPVEAAAVEPCPVCPEGWRVVGKTSCPGCAGLESRAPVSEQPVTNVREFVAALADTAPSEYCAPLSDPA